MPRRPIPLRVLMEDPAPLPADCGYIHPLGEQQALYSHMKMMEFDRRPQHFRMVESIAGDPGMAKFICQRTATEDRAEIDAIARQLWEQSRKR